MHPSYKRAARLRQVILNRVTSHLRDSLDGLSPRTGKLAADIDELIVELIAEVRQDVFGEFV
jgi:hypothetical protein